MAKRTYRTAAGQTVDFGAMLSQNETVPAIGNMNVNARGDEINPDGEIVKTRDQLMKEYHQMNTMVPQDSRIPESASDIDPELQTEPQELVKTKEPATEDVAQPVATAESESVQEEAKEEPRPSAGLASAVAASKTVKSNVTKKPKPKEVSGVTRL